MISLLYKPADPVPERLVNFKVWMIKNGIDFSLVTECAKTNPEGVSKQCEVASRIVIFGSDDIINAAISATKSLNKEYGIVPGPVCDIASALGINKLYEEEIFAAAVNGATVAVDSWKVNGSYLMLSSLSFGAPAAAKAGHGDKCCANHLQHLKQAWKKAAAATYKISCDGTPAGGQYAIVSVLNAKDVDGVNYVADSSAQDGTLEVVVMKSGGFMGKLFGTGFGTGPVGANKDSKVLKGKKVAIECPEADCSIDGAIVKLAKAEIEAGDKIKIACKP